MKRTCQVLEATQSLRFPRHDESILQLLSTKEEHSSKIESHSSIFSKVETRLVDMDKKMKAVAESLLITSEGQFSEMKKEYDGQIAELVAVTNEQGQVLDSHNESLAHVAERSRKMDKDLLVTNREVEELKRQTEDGQRFARNKPRGGGVEEADRRGQRVSGVEVQGDKGLPRVLLQVLGNNPVNSKRRVKPG